MKTELEKELSKLGAKHGMGKVLQTARALRRNEDFQRMEDKPRFTKGDFLSDFQAVQEWCYRIARMKGFHDKPRDAGLAMALIHSEVTEALEALRKGPDEPSEHIPEFTALEEELADIIIRVLDFAEEYDSPTPGKDMAGLCIIEALFAKVSYNAKREKMHGGKTF